MSSPNLSYTKSLYNEDYFEYGQEMGVSLYTDYHWLPELTIPFCAELIAQLGISHTDTILDLGCAKGYMVKAFRLLGREAYGVDISEYAISCAPEDVKPYITLINTPDDIPCPPNGYDWIIAKDVFEHVDILELNDLLDTLRLYCNQLFAIIPIGDGSKFLSPREEKDVTHQIRECLTWWRDRFMEVGFKSVTFGYLLPHILEMERKKGWFICA